ncbi:MAG: YihA family ribosome biogenesis GTP-binding protein [Bacteroidales bacterium]|nr:YihA family ribosome biogenesis GTP-binding protein [Bacteroidales bacterium]MBN2750495.1 YihA family ribosome biogenesis GTP-binding protein [Bacteroidales bacterium]
MQIRSAKFVKSSPSVKLCPDPKLPEYAFIGRSNVGKSSLINMLVGDGTLAKVSGRPGKTQLINHFIVNGNWYLVDLPGYGYAKVSKSLRSGFSQIIKGYVLERENLYCLFVLIDSRLEPQKNDLEFLEWLGQNQVPFAIVFTKVDKLGKIQLDENIRVYKERLLEGWEELPSIFLSSAVKRDGREDIMGFIDEVNSKTSLLSADME